MPTEYTQVEMEIPVVRSDQVVALSKEFHALARRYTVTGGFSFGTQSTEWEKSDEDH